MARSLKRSSGITPGRMLSFTESPRVRALSNLLGFFTHPRTSQVLYSPQTSSSSTSTRITIPSNQLDP
jgi:hypothetical protein